MKVLFLTRLFTRETIGREPLGMLYLSSALKRAGHECMVADAASWRQAKRKAQAYNPDLLVYPTVCTGLQDYYLQLNRQLKALLPKSFSVFGGPHPTFFPEMVYEQGVDAICRGEGEDALVELAGKLSRGLPIAETDNWWIKEDGQVFQNGLRPLMEDLDQILFPDRTLLDSYKAFGEYPIKSFLSGRGCPYKCSYCFNKAFHELYSQNGKVIRKRSVKNLIKEIEEVKKNYPLQLVLFEDDIFILQKEWLEEFAEVYPKAIALPFACNVRANLVTERAVKALKRAGCLCITMGIEAGNEKLRREMLNRSMTDEEILEACRLIKGHGIRLITENIVGIPGGCLEDDLMTLRLNQRAQPDYANCHILLPYPRTEMAAIAIAKGLIDDGYAYQSFPSPYKATVLSLKEKRKTENLMRFFALAVTYPWINDRLPLLISLPLKPFYSALFKLFKVYSMKSRIFKVRLKPSLLFHSLLSLLRHP